MPTQLIIDDDIVKVKPKGAPKGKKVAPLAVLFWGDVVKVVDEVGGQKIVELSRDVFDVATKTFVTKTELGELPAKARFRDKPILKVRFVDVGQGDGAVIETPSGKIILIDGGEELH